MGKNSKDKKTMKGKSSKGTGNRPQDFLKGDRGTTPKCSLVQSETDSSAEESGESRDTTRDERTARQERRARKMGKHTTFQKPQLNEESSEEEDEHNTRKALATLSNAAEQMERSSEQEFPPWRSSKVEAPGDGGISKATPLQKLMKADRKLFKAISVIATETAENETVSSQLDLIINEVSKMKSLILEATHEVAGLQGELRATRGATGMGQSPTPSMADVIRDTAQWEPDRQPSPPKYRESIVVKSAIHGTDELSKLITQNIDPCSLGLRDVETRPVRDGVVISSTSKEAIASLQKELKSNDATGHAIEVTQGKKRLPQIKVVGINEDLSDEEMQACLLTQNDLRCTADDFILAKTWKGRGGKTACFDITKRASEALRGKTHLNIKWTRCRFFDNTFIARCKNCSQVGHVEKFCGEASRCTDCGGAHHFRQCKNHQKNCSACERELPRAKRDHSFLSLDCPVFKDAQARRTRELIARL
ncbi:hypothetical protein HPB52_024705 [Rhipicephalus sanguineus]|uniref:Gag-like protein n=1 Tax=Rhipicephalus sanguineus TaxID=34632 RepID=A0A9D4SMD3_RHISA|nr:hypothetical protein HPB52_024705 [Rhipicephalus sanguineus]